MMMYGVVTFLDDDPFCLFAYLIYGVLMLKFAASRRVILAKPLDLYFLLTIIGFGVFYPYYYNNPDSLFFLNEDTYRPQFRFEKIHLAKSFNVFLFGTLWYYVGSVSHSRPLLLNFKEYRPKIVILSLSSIVLVVIFAAFRMYFKIRLPGNDDVAFPFVGYIFNPGIFAIQLLTTYCICSLVHAKTKFDVALLMIPGYLYAISLAVIGIKSGVIFYVLTVLLFYQTTTIKGWALSKKTGRAIIGVAFIQIVVAYLSYGVIGFYRISLIESGYNFADALYEGFTQEYFAHVGETQQGFSDSKLLSIFERVAGINYLVPIIAYYDMDYGGGYLSLIKSFLTSSESNAEKMLTRTILGVPDNVITTNAPGGIGALYIHGGLFGVMLGMYLLGFWSKKIFHIAILNATERNLVVSIYIVALLQIVVPVVIEGTIINFLKINIPAMIIGATLVALLLNILQILFKQNRV